MTRRRLTTTCTGAAEANFSSALLMPLGGPVMSSVKHRRMTGSPCLIAAAPVRLWVHRSQLPRSERCLGGVKIDAGVDAVGAAA
jgi:hypothetical protein